MSRTLIGSKRSKRYFCVKAYEVRHRHFGQKSGAKRSTLSYRSTTSWPIAAVRIANYKIRSPDRDQRIW